MIAPIGTLGSHREFPPSTNCGAQTGIVKDVLRRQVCVATEKPSGSFVQRSIGRYPAVAVVSSVAIGIALGWLVKRKWNR